MTLAGEKKCVPTTLSGLLVAPAISSTDSVDVLVARMQPGLQLSSRREKICFFRSMFSNAASTTMSAEDRAPYPSPPSTGTTREQSASTCSALILPLRKAEERSSVARMLATPCSAPARDTSTSEVLIPICAKHMAIPTPIVPAPITAASFTVSRVSTRGRPATLLHSRSAKKTCWRAGPCAPVMSASKISASFLSPASKLSLSTAARAASAMREGAANPLALAAALSTSSSRTAGELSPGTALSHNRRSARSAPRQASDKANSIAASSSASPPASPPAASTISSTTPSSNASAAPTMRPVVMISTAFSTPESRGRRWVPPAPGQMPR